MSRYRGKPVEVDAVRAVTVLWDAEHNWAGLPGWLVDAYERGDVLFVGQPTPSVLIHTLEGSMTARREDWIIRGVQGEIYPCKPEIFDATYEPVSGDAA